MNHVSYKILYKYDKISKLEVTSNLMLFLQCNEAIKVCRQRLNHTKQGESPNSSEDEDTNQCLIFIFNLYIDNNLYLVGLKLLQK